MTVHVPFSRRNLLITAGKTRPDARFSVFTLNADGFSTWIFRVGRIIAVSLRQA